MDSANLMTEAEVSDYFGIPRSQLRKWRCVGRGPAYVKLGRAVRYLRSDVETFVRAGRVEPQEVG